MQVPASLTSESASRCLIVNTLAQTRIGQSVSVFEVLIGQNGRQCHTDTLGPNSRFYWVSALQWWKERAEQQNKQAPPAMAC
jgi:hypothetical protein